MKVEVGKTRPRFSVLVVFMGMKLRALPPKLGEPAPTFRADALSLGEPSRTGGEASPGLGEPSPSLRADAPGVGEPTRKLGEHNGNILSD